MIKFCTIKLSTVLENKNNCEISKLLELINKSQDIFIYHYDNTTNKLFVCTHLWVDIKPTYSTLIELINEMVSSLKSIILTLENGGING